MKKKLLTVVPILITVCLLFMLCFIPSTFASDTVCQKCGAVLHDNGKGGSYEGEQSELAKAFGLTLCMSCWLDVLYGSSRSVTVPAVTTLVNGKVPTVQLGGEGADSTKFLRGDQTWVTVTGGSTTWGQITGTLSTQTDLQSVLDAKWSNSASYGITTQDISNWNTVFGWGNHASAGYLTTITGTNLDNVFTSNGLLKRTGVGTYIVDSSIYLTGNQNITLNGDASGSGATSIAVTNTALRNVSIPTLSTGYLYYNGSSFAWQTPSSSGFDPIATVTLWDEFASGLLTTGNIGNLGWGLTGTAPTVIASEVNHIGIRQIPTTTTSGNISAIWLGGAVNTDTVRYNDYCDMTFIVRMTDVTSDTAFVGAMDAMGTAVGNQDRYGFEYIDSSDTYWMIVTGNGSTSTRTATNITVAINTWYKLRVVRDGSGVNYYINGTNVGSVATTLPDTSLNVGFHIQTNTTVAKYLQADLFSLTLGVTR
jgi:hypothetical protein